MSGRETVPHRIESVPVKALRVEVVRGPDAGKRADAAADVISIGSGEGNDLVLTDDTVSRYHLEVRRSERAIVVVDHGSTNGTRLGSARLLHAQISPGTILELGKSAIRIDDAETVDCEVLGEDQLGRLRGRTAQMRRLMATAKRAAKTDASILILGETGTGKEVLAQAIHDESSRNKEPFETVDCGSLLSTLIASELFGHEKGAFTGAEHRHEGAFERANGGTLFLDEIGELPTALQSALLGALERRSFRRVGGTKPIAVDVRIIAATNRDLRADVNQTIFREDLYYRLAVLLMHLPPLRERTDDIPLLVEAFLRDLGHSEPVETVIPREVMATLARHRWPGNVRELRNFVEAALAIGEAQPISGAASSSANERDDRQPEVSLSISGHDDKTYRAVRDAVTRELERLYFPALLERSNGSITEAAKRADMDRTYLGRVLKRLGLR